MGCVSYTSRMEDNQVNETALARGGVVNFLSWNVKGFKSPIKRN